MSSHKLSDFPVCIEECIKLFARGFHNVVCVYNTCCLYLNLRGDVIEKTWG
jgi:hypothetical protein